MATCPFFPTDLRPAALCLMRLGLLHLSIALSLASCTLPTTPLNAFYLNDAPFRLPCADFLLVFHSSPLLSSCFLGSLPKASFPSVWRFLFKRRGFRGVLASILRIRSPQRSFVCLYLANWPPLSCMVESISILPSSTYHNEHFIFWAPIRSFGL